MNPHEKNILVVGYTYISDTSRNTFNFYPHPEQVFFLVPDFWKARGGKVIFYGLKEKNIFLTKTFFHHSHYPLIGGLLKGWMPAFPLILLKLKWSKNIKLVYSCSEPALLATLYNGFWTRVFGMKYVSYSWENLPYEKRHSGKKGLLRKFILQLSLFFCDGLICGNKKSLDIHKQYMRSKPITLFPMNGLDPDFFKPQNSPKTFRNINLQNKIVFSFAGMIAKRKGIYNIINALPIVLERLSSIHLIIAGSGEDEAGVKDQIEKLNILKYITWVPWVDHNELVKILAVSNVFLYPSIPYQGWEEQFGYAMVEASFMELPIISTRSGSIEEVVLNGKTGILVPPNDTKALAEAMIYLGQDKNLREQLGKAGRDHALVNFSNEVIANKFYVFFSSLIK